VDQKLPFSKHRNLFYISPERGKVFEALEIKIETCGKSEGEGRILSKLFVVAFHFMGL
jgi:hypothetical protein